MLTSLVIAAIVGYLLGSLPFGYLVARAKGVNIFEVGSRNPGATNVRRVLGSGPGNIVLAADAAKGAAATFAPYGWRLVTTSDWSSNAGRFGPTEYGYFALAGLVGAMLGHSYSCFTRFRGGKGVATGAGGFAVLFPVGALIALVVWLVTAALSRYVSLASMLAAVSLPVAALALGRSVFLIVASALIALFVVIRHRANIVRLLGGTENKIGQSAAERPTL
jgi:acyl phosphate:glycerol-3-phosphate acyltransferase